MRWTETIELIQINYIRDELNQEIPIEVKRTVRANPWRLTFSEQLQAGSENQKGFLKFEIITLNYQGERLAVYRGRKYSVNVQPNGARSILTLQELAHYERAN